VALSSRHESGLSKVFRQSSYRSSGKDDNLSRDSLVEMRMNALRCWSEYIKSSERYGQT
jgi:hypothetical protein